MRGSMERALNNSAVECHVLWNLYLSFNGVLLLLWNPLPELVKDTIGRPTHHSSFNTQHTALELTFFSFKALTTPRHLSMAAALP